MLTITFSWTMDSALQLFMAWTALLFFPFRYLIFTSEHGYWIFFGYFTSERISGRHALRNFSKDNLYDLAVFALLVPLPAGLHVLGILERERIDIFYCAASLAVLAHRLHFFRAFACLEICLRITILETC